MKNKVWSLSIIIMSLLSNNIYAADKTVQAIPSNKIFILPVKMKIKKQMV